MVKRIMCALHFARMAQPKGTWCRRFAANASSLGGIQRVNLGFFGRMNAGKSTLMNFLTQQQTSIVDATAGTTADTKVTLLELHGIGPCKVFDTAGLDESGDLGAKKLRKTAQVAKECDLILIAYRPYVETAEQALQEPGTRKILDIARSRNRQVALIENVSDEHHGSGFVELGRFNDIPRARVNPTRPEGFDAFVAFLERLHVSASRASQVPLLPLKFMGKDKRLLMNIPMDAETPSGRLLRPQANVQEFALSHYTSTSAFRMDLAAGRSRDLYIKAQERSRFQECVLREQPDLIVTDSQAMDLVYPWLSLPDFQHVALTTFSIVVLSHAGADLDRFIAGLRAFDSLEGGDRVLVAEACNHNRITQVCEDIGTVQIPRHIRKKGRSDQPEIIIEHAFGREFPDDELRRYSLVIHCGGCMIDSQKLQARIEDCKELGVPITNYGLLLSHVQSPGALQKVVAPFLS
ncbi:tRNA modification GTPase MnmE [Porphyridium purpureum]|uniref:tRNA modification GTPase MnmE n=1 Tax=Porphyridium purpureum TaxID=35688 RepID=A0A5J4Z2T2_PORPP|nr:tRNA modification GTPase MnmE [Porphyridium purpureum]|eukprot:POR3929..scf208_2